MRLCRQQISNFTSSQLAAYSRSAKIFATFNESLVSRLERKMTFLRFKRSVCSRIAPTSTRWRDDRTRIIFALQRVSIIMHNAPGGGDQPISRSFCGNNSHASRLQPSSLSSCTQENLLSRMRLDSPRRLLLCFAFYIIARREREESEEN